MQRPGTSHVGFGVRRQLTASGKRAQFCRALGEDQHLPLAADTLPQGELTLPAFGVSHQYRRGRRGRHRQRGRVIHCRLRETIDDRTHIAVRKGAAQGLGHTAHRGRDDSDDSGRRQPQRIRDRLAGWCVVVSGLRLHPSDLLLPFFDAAAAGWTVTVLTVVVTAG